MSDNDLLVIVVLASIPLVIAFYLLPAIVAFRRHHPNRWLILAVTVMLGSTGFGWAFALVWAFGAAHRSEETGGSHGGESGLNLFVNDVRSVRIASGSDQAADAVIPARLTASEAVQQIERLDRLRVAGHIDANEFAMLKADVLQRH